MQPYQQAFIDLALQAEALRFGEFTLKSGRCSPYFFNAGQFSHGRQLAALGYCYAAQIAQSGIEFDLLFGPAYKGIPLAAVTAAALATEFNIDVPYAFNRKEAKQHGEGGNFVGAEVTGRVLIVDDVITAGTAVREVVELLQALPSASVCGVVVGLDRQETLVDRDDGLSAVEALKRSLGIPVQSIIALEHLVEYLSNNHPDTLGGESAKLIESIQDYRKQYGCH